MASTLMVTTSELRKRADELQSNLHQKQKLRHRQKLRNRFRIA